MSGGEEEDGVTDKAGQNAIEDGEKREAHVEDKLDDGGDDDSCRTG